MQKGLLRPRHRDDEGARRLEDRKDRSCNCRRCPEDRRCTLTFPMHRQAAVRRPAQDQRRIVQRFRADGRRPSCVGRAHNPETPWRCRGSFGSRSLTISPSMRISPPGASSARDHTQDGALAAARWPDEHHNYSGIDRLALTALLKSSDQRIKSLKTIATTACGRLRCRLRWGFSRRLSPTQHPRGQESDESKSKRLSEAATGYG